MAQLTPAKIVHLGAYFVGDNANKQGKDDHAARREKKRNNAA